METIFIFKQDSKTLPIFEVWKCNENGVPLPSKPLILLILQTIFGPGLYVKNLTTAKRQLKRPTAAFHREEYLQRGSSAETAIPDSSTIEVERIWLCCTFYTLRAASVGTVDRRDSRRGTDCARREVSDSSTGTRIPTSFSVDSRSSQQHKTCYSLSSISCFASFGSFLAKSNVLPDFSILEGERHSITNLYDLESEIQPEISGYIDCEPHLNQQFRMHSIAVSSDSRFIALIRNASLMDQTGTNEIHFQIELMVSTNSEMREIRGQQEDF